MIHKHRHVRAGLYSVNGTRKATHYATLERYWTRKGGSPRGWYLTIREVDTKEDVSLGCGKRHFKTAREGIARAKELLNHVHRDIKDDRRWADMTTAPQQKAGERA